MHELSFMEPFEAWDPTRPLTADELRYWISIHRPPSYLDSLIPYEKGGYAWVPLVSHRRLPFIDIAREIHRQGYGRYFPHPERLPKDPARRRILRADTDATQQPGVYGIAWMSYNKQSIDSEEDIYGLTYELAPPDRGPRSADGWRALPVAKLFLPADRPSPITQWGLRRLDELERSGANIVELSGISVRPTTPHPGHVFHEIMRRLVHQAIMLRTYGGAEKVLVFAMVEQVRDRVMVRIGDDNLVPLGESFLPPGEGVKDTVRLAPHIVELYPFLDRLVTSYRKAQSAGLQLETRVKGILHYTRGIPWRFICQYPAMIELLAELDSTVPGIEPRSAASGWHDRCEHNEECRVCHPPVSVYDHIRQPHHGEYLIL